MSNCETHKQETRMWDGTVKITETKPILECSVLMHCKYCHTDHRDWRVMDPMDYGIAGIVLCGNCGHTSKDEELEVGMLATMYEIAGHTIDHVCEEKIEKMRDGLRELASKRYTEGSAN